MTATTPTRHRCARRWRCWGAPPGAGSPYSATCSSSAITRRGCTPGSPRRSPPVAWTACTRPVPRCAICTTRCHPRGAAPTSTTRSTCCRSCGPNCARATRCWSKVRSACAWGGSSRRCWRTTSPRPGSLDGGGRPVLFNLLYPLADQFGLFNLFRYITFRTGGAVLTALVISFVVGPSLIHWLRVRQGNGQPIRGDGPASHLLRKQGTPTMGGTLILLALTLATLLWADLTNGYVWVVLLITLGFGTIGLVDDYLKVTRRSSGGLRSRTKLLGQALVALMAAGWIAALTQDPLATGLALPFLKDVLVPLGLLFFPFAMLVMIGASNAVNLTDGLDGLAIVPTMIVASCYALIAYLVGNAIFANYLGIPFVPGTGELAVFCGALLGASLGFLWFNAPPAMVFMGDTGSLASGGALGAVAVITKHELVLVVVGGLFVLETVSVIVQVASFKLTGKRVFRMAPLHHRFEQKGWEEPTIVIRFWIIAMVLALIGLSTLKLR